MCQGACGQKTGENMTGPGHSWNCPAFSPNSAFCFLYLASTPNWDSCPGTFLPWQIHPNFIQLASYWSAPLRFDNRNSTIRMHQEAKQMKTSYLYFAMYLLIMTAAITSTITGSIYDLWHWFALRELHSIPHICHFFTRAKFLDNKIYTEKRQFSR